MILPEIQTHAIGCKIVCQYGNTSILLNILPLLKRKIEFRYFGGKFRGKLQEAVF